MQNTGNRAAENCKATLILDEEEYRLGWMIPCDNLTVVINAHDREFLDLCAISQTDDGWQRIFTTERGYGDNQKEGREFKKYDKKPISAQLKISSKNSETCRKKIWISAEPDKDNKVVNFKATVE